MSKTLPRFKIVVRKSSSGGASTEYTTGVNFQGNSAEVLKDFSSRLRENEKVIGVYYLMADEKHCDDLMQVDTANA